MTNRASSDQIAGARRLWEDSGLTIDEICVKVGRSAPWLYYHARKDGWLARKTRRMVRLERKLKVDALPKNVRRTTGGKPMLSSAGWAAKHRQDEAASEAELYGALLPHVRFLRRHGYAVHIEDGRFRVGNKLLTAAELVAFAQREMRVLRDKNATQVDRQSGR